MNIERLIGCCFQYKTQTYVLLKTCHRILSDIAIVVIDLSFLTFSLCAGTLWTLSAASDALIDIFPVCRDAILPQESANTM
jgi:hypothetical protein